MRSYASKGIVDVCYVDREGTAHLEQLKFSSKGNARISGDEFAALLGFARSFVGCPCHISLVLKNSHQKEKVYRLNIKGLENIKSLADLKKFYGE